MPKNIILMGYRGAGKTCTASYLAEKLGRKVISTDIEIEKKAGSIKEFVEKHGWDKFRDIESNVIANIKENNLIIDCGGGFIERGDNIKNLKKNGIVIWLKASPKQIRARIKENCNRPSLTGAKSFLDEIEEVLKKREPLYKKAADYEIDTDNKSIKEIANSIIRIIRMPTKICIPITAATLEQVLIDLSSAEKYTDLIELRIDYIHGINDKKLKKLLSGKTKKVIVTCRPKSLCGNFEGNEEERINLLKEAIKLNAEFVDIEIESGKEEIKKLIDNKNNTELIISYHNFKETPSLEQLEKKYKEIKTLNPDLIKIVANANSINDNFIIFKLLKGKNDLIAFCIGIKGQISRILAPKYNSRLTFASLKEGKESASGQIPIDEMKKTYNFDLINNDTEVLGVIGEFAENSMSKYMHNASFKARKINFIYVPFKVRKEELKGFIKNLREFNFKGSSVTVPHKIEITKYIDEVEKTGKEIGAVNTIVNENRKLIGYNTDYYGAVEALKEKTGLKNKKVLLIGAGGASRAIIYGLKKEDAGITVINRTNEKAKELANEFKVKYGNFKNKKELIKNSDIIINATSVGMNPNPNESIINETDLAEGKIVMDIVYKPIETKLIKLAKKAKCSVITGDRMLFYQAIRQFNLWTKKKFINRC